LKVFPKGTFSFQDPRTNAGVPSHTALLALYDKPAPALQLNAFTADAQPIHMTFPCTLAGQEVNVLVDTGASHSFMDVAFATQHGFFFWGKKLLHTGVSNNSNQGRTHRPHNMGHGSMFYD